MKKNKIPPSIEELSKRSKELDKIINLEKSDLAKVLVATSFIDTTLSSLLNKFFINSKISNRIISNIGFLGNYQAKSDISYILGLISKPLYNNIVKIGEIRNKFAHDFKLTTFNDEEIEKLCMQIDYWDKIKKVEEFSIPKSIKSQLLESTLLSPKNRFTMNVVIITQHLLLIGLEIKKQDINIKFVKENK